MEVSVMDIGGEKVFVDFVGDTPSTFSIPSPAKCAP
jgi:hypothetical protein